mgnify:CR=1 FL=1
MNVEDVKKILEQGNGVYTKQEPFVMCYTSFLRNEKYKAAEKTMYLILKSYGMSKDNCFPSQKTLSKNASMDRTTVIDVLKRLEEKGLIVSIFQKDEESGRYTSKNYFLADIDSASGEIITESLETARIVKKYIVDNHDGIGTVIRKK